MSMIKKGSKPEISPELIEDIVKRAHEERAEAVRQLFGFGFKVVTDAVRGTTRHGHRVGQPPAAATRG